MVVLSIFIVAAKRLWSTRWLALASALGLVVAVSLTLSVPMYSDAVYYRILHQQLVAWGDTRQPPFAFMYRYVGDTAEPAEWSMVMAADQVMQSQIPNLLQLPRQLLVRYFVTAAYPVFANKDAAYTDTRQPVARTSFGMLSDFADHITLVDGVFPADMTDTDPAAVMPVLVSKVNADKLGLQPGERYLVYDESAAQHDATKAASQVPIVIAGVWSPRDTADPYWYTNPAELQDLLISSENNFMRRLAPQLKGEQYLAVWYMVFNGDRVRAGDVPGFLDRMNVALAHVSAVLPGMRMDHSPEVPLKRYQETTNLLTVQLFAFSIPLLGLTYIFIALVAGLTVNNQRGEIAVLRSRGASIFQVVGIAFLEACVLGAIALGLSSPAAQWIAQLVGQTRSFLVFADPGATGAPFVTAITLDSMRLGLLTAALAVLIIVIPTLGASRDTVITYKQDRARSLRPPWWQRIGLDVLVFIPAAYGTYLLQKQGVTAIQTVTAPGGTPSDPFSNPLLFLVPMLAMIAISLFLVRLLPLVLRFLSWVISTLPGASILLAMRLLARSPGFYAAPILLLTLTVALAVFTASLAVTVDQNTIDQLRYRIGGDMSVTESLDNSAGMSAASLAQDSTLTELERAALEAAKTRAQLTNSMLPVQDHLRIQNVEGAARVGRYPASAQVGSATLRSEFIGVDRQDFARVSFWRKDFASAPLATMMNALAASDNSVLVPDTTMSRYGLHPGDQIIVRVSLKEGSAALKLRVAGDFKLWPGWYPREKDGTILFVGNLDYLFEQAGYQAPYRVLLKIKDGSNIASIAQGILDTGFNLIRYESVAAQIRTEQSRPERQGLFGVLSVGFGASALLTVLGFFLYSIFSFRRRLVELGVLRAIGFSTVQTAAFLCWELMLLLGVGVGAGTGLGLAASKLYVPFMQYSATSDASTIPFQVVIAWPSIFIIYGLFGALFIVALLALLVFLSRMRVFQAVKLGESV